ncbi:hypothetical protein GHCGIGKI_00725 [Klebsiella phage P01]|nr:hypothetical protein GHCGIGKI_00725 [Klebsiella phage P01]
MSTPNFLDFMKERDQLDEAFNSAPYELTMGKKNAGDVFFTFIDEDDKEYRIQFYTPQGLGKNVRQVFIGQKRGSVYPDAIARFKNPMRVIASMIEATKQFMATPLGKTIDGYAVNFSKKALDRGMTLIPKIIRQSGLKQKLNVMDLTYAPVPDRGYVWLVKKGKDPAQVFDGPKMQGITWDDPDKVGDVPVQNNTPDVGTGAGSSEIEVNREWYNSSDTGLELKSGRDPIRGNYVRLISGSKEVAAFYGYDFDKYPDGTEVSWNMKRGFTNQDLVGASMTKQKKGMYDQYTFKKGAQIILVVDVDTSNDTGSDELTKSKWLNLLNYIGYSKAAGGKLFGDDEYIKNFVKDRYKLTLSIARRNQSVQMSVNAWNATAEKWVAFPPSVGVLENVDISDPKRFPKIIDDFVQTATDYVEKNLENVVVGWYNKTAPAGQPVLEFREKSGMYGGGINVIPSSGTPVYGVYYGASSKLRSFAEVSGSDLGVLAKTLKLPPIPSGVAKEFTKAATAWWKQKNITPPNTDSGDQSALDNLKIPRNATVFGETVNGMSITWSGINFPETGKYGGAVLTTNVTCYYDKDKVAFTPMISQKGRLLNNPKTYELPLKKTIVQAVIDEISSKMEILSRNMQTLKSTSYNPKQVFLDDIVVDNNGSVLWRGHDMADRRTTEFMLGILNDENSRLEKEGSKGKTAADLATYAASIEESAPKGRDLDWRVYLTNNGNSLQVDWEITFRRNTRVGAMKEFSAQVYRGNRYLEDVYADAKSRGYAPEQPNLMAMSDAQRSDDMAMMNGEDAYSEYEQSIGGSLKINLK